VDHSLLRSWLGLPPGPWPPDHYTLLGLPPAPCDAAAVEARVLERMDLLRRHQLRHPELVTEGMNRLAQALITLTDPAGKLADDAERGAVPAADASPAATPATPAPPLAEPSPPGSVVVAEPLVDDDVFSDDAATAETEPTDGPEMTQVIELQWPLTGTQPPLPAGAPVVTWGKAPEPPKRPVEPPYEVVPEERREPLPLRPPRPDVVDAVVVGPASKARSDPQSRRWIYVRLALIRRAMRAWDRLRPVIADPQDPVDRPGRVVVLLEAAHAVRPLLPKLRGIVGGVGEPGGLVAAVVKQVLLMDTFRRLLPDQRQAVAIDWRRGQTSLQAEYGRLRRLSRAGRPERAGAPAVMILVRWLKETPELVLILLGLLAVLIALFREAVR
jgi:hypothetical protein